MYCIAIATLSDERRRLRDIFIKIARSATSQALSIGRGWREAPGDGTRNAKMSRSDSAGSLLREASFRWTVASAPKGRMMVPLCEDKVERWALLSCFFYIERPSSGATAPPSSRRRLELNALRAFVIRTSGANKKSSPEATPALNSQFSILNSFMQEREARCDNQSSSCTVNGPRFTENGKQRDEPQKPIAV